jgi:hypothetical protein
MKTQLALLSLLLAGSVVAQDSSVKLRVEAEALTQAGVCQAKGGLPLFNAAGSVALPVSGAWCFFQDSAPGVPMRGRMEYMGK